MASNFLINWEARLSFEAEQAGASGERLKPKAKPNEASSLCRRSELRLTPKKC